MSGTGAFISWEASCTHAAMGLYSSVQISLQAGSFADDEVIQYA